VPPGKGLGLRFQEPHYALSDPEWFLHASQADFATIEAGKALLADQ
jgi:hypothetical protein